MYDADRELVDRMMTGDQRAFDEFFKTATPRLTAFISRRSGLNAAGVEDVVQCAMIKAVRNLKSYRGEAALYTWLTGICRNELIDVQRKTARIPAQVSLDESSSVRERVELVRAPPQDEPTWEHGRAPIQELIMQVLKQMPEQYATVLEAKYGDGMAVKDIARQMGMTPTAVQSLLARARGVFRERWEDFGADPTFEGAIQ